MDGGASRNELLLRHSLGGIDAESSSTAEFVIDSSGFLVDSTEDNLLVQNTPAQQATEAEPTEPFLSTVLSELQTSKSRSASSAHHDHVGPLLLPFTNKKGAIEYYTNELRR